MWGVGGVRDVLELFDVCETCVQVQRARCVRSTSTTAVPTRDPMFEMCEVLEECEVF